MLKEQTAKRPLLRLHLLHLLLLRLDLPLRLAPHQPCAVAALRVVTFTPPAHRHDFSLHRCVYFSLFVSKKKGKTPQAPERIIGSPNILTFDPSLLPQ